MREPNAPAQIAAVTEAYSSLHSEPTTPLMRQYAAVKKQHPTALVFFRLGDFYELFFEDAIVAAKELQITLTSRNKEKGVAIPMCGVPYHAAENYLGRLIRRGFKVAICEQVEEAGAAMGKSLPKALAPKNAGKKLVRREVTRVVTPGTALDSSLAAGENNFLAAVATVSGRTGFAALDLSTGDFRATEFAGDAAWGRVQEELEQLRPKELLYASSAPLFENRYGPQNQNKDASTRSLGISNESGALGPVTTRPGMVQPSTAQPITAGAHWAETPLDDWIFSPDHAIPLVENHFGVLSLEGFGLAGRPAAAAAAGAILHYVRSTQRGSLDHIDRIGWYERQSALVLDAVTVRNLELIEPLLAAGDGRATLLGAIDRTLTPMGRRLLRAWLLRPSIDLAEINARLDAVEAAVKNVMTRAELRRSLDGILDLERLLSRVTLETANPRDLLALGGSLGKIPAVKSAVEKTGGAKGIDRGIGRGIEQGIEQIIDPGSGRWPKLNHELDPLAGLREKIAKTLVPEPPLSFADGGVIAQGVDPELDELRELSRSGKQVLAQIEQRERARTSISSLKVKFNSIFGYYIEVSRPNLHLVPADYERRQTLVGAERFTTPELKEYEAKILDAQEKIAIIERRLFTELRQAVAAEAKPIRRTALALAQVDVLASLAETAALHNYCRPQFDQEHGETAASASALSPGDTRPSGFQKNDSLEIIAGRHPVLERLERGASLAGEGSNARFVPNDLFLNSTTHNILLLTGPNMGGKSTYLRQTALIAILAQMGSFVPARAARLPVFDRVFTRIGASDNLARGRSTFMVEMTETAAILHTATPKSLILLDEVGRGTATYDGLAIAWAAVEYLHERVRAKTLFATHYFELTELASQLVGVKNFHVAVKETAGGIAFLRKVEPGAADRSYGIEVAKLAGLPGEVVERARAVLAGHESTEQEARERLEQKKDERPAQLTIFTPLSQPVVEKLREVDLDRLTPLEALNLLAELKRQID